MDVPLAGLPGAALPEQSVAGRGPAALPPARVIRSWESEYVVRCFLLCEAIQLAVTYNLALTKSVG